MKGSKKAKGEFGNKAGPNLLFQSAMHAASKYGFYTFQMELDCLPLRAGWLDEISGILENQTAWVIGSPYSGDKGIDKAIQFHINGNALYRCGSEEFLRFVDELWIKRILSLRDTFPNLAYDCWWALEMSRSSAPSRNDAWIIWQEYCYRFVYYPLLVNLTVATRYCREYLMVRDRLEIQGLRPLFFHGAAIGKVIGFLHDNMKCSVEEAIVAVAAQAIPSPYGAGQSGGENAKPTLFPPVFLDETSPAKSRIMLAKGFYAVEGPSERFFPVRYVWTSSREFSFVPITLSGDIELVFREIKGRSFLDLGAPTFTVDQKGLPLDCVVEILEPPMFCRLDIKVPSDGAFELIRIFTSAPLLDDYRGPDQPQGLLLFEHGIQIIET